MEGLGHAHLGTPLLIKTSASGRFWRTQAALPTAPSAGAWHSALGFATRASNDSARNRRSVAGSLACAASSKDLAYFLICSRSARSGNGCHVITTSMLEPAVRNEAPCGPGTCDEYIDSGLRRSIRLVMTLCIGYIPLFASHATIHHKGNALSHRKSAGRQR
jgi:hypothetical protein